MAVEAPRQTQLEAAAALLEHLKLHPSELSRPAADLAQRFGLTAGFVQEVISNASGLQTWEVDRPITPRIRFEFWRKFGHWLKRLFLAGFGNPVLFVIVSTIAAVGLLIAADQFVPDGSQLFGIVSTQGILAALIGIGTIIGHLCCFYVNRKVKAPLQAAGVMWILLTIFVAMGVFLTGDRDSVAQRATAAIFGVLAMLFLVAGYGLAGVIAAVLGSWIRARNVEQQTLRMSRQELLERYFELQARLEKGGTRERVVSWLEDSPTAKFFRRSPMLIGSVIFFGCSVLGSVSDRQLTPGPSDTPFTVNGVLGLIIALILLAVRGVTYVGSGLFARNIPQAMLASVMMTLADYGGDFLPVSTKTPADMTSVPILVASVFQMAVGVIMSGFAAVAADVQRRNARQVSLENNDSATLLAEMLRIQWRLADSANSTCILVIDAAKSSQMKANADPLIVEFSFRQYQEWIAETVRGFSGKVHFTAGDGAVVAFPDCERAFAAARRLQTDIGRFNLERNRLEMPFRVRIGLHVGHIAGAIDDVQFTEVIDIAAHIEAVATVGGIAVTEPVALALPEHEFLPIAQVVDGQRVFLARSPTEEA